MPEQHVDLDLDSLSASKTVRVGGEVLEVKVPSMKQMIKLESIMGGLDKENVGDKFGEVEEFVKQIVPDIEGKGIELNAAQFAKLLELITSMVNTDSKKKEQEEKTS